jgi:hypothetical protein
MRVWDVEPERLCRQHLLAEHREIHGIWVTITEGKKAYANHPETLRWRGRLAALYLKHEQVVQEMLRRGYTHSSLLPAALATGEDTQPGRIDSTEAQMAMLKSKGCACRVSLEAETLTP